MPRAAHPVVYLCAEYGLEPGLPLFAGGLGVLAGDTVKAAADAQLPFVAIGLVYKGYHARQRIDQDGWQHDEPYPFSLIEHHFQLLNINNQPVRVTVPLAQESAQLQVWQRQLGDDTWLYLLDPDVDGNSDTVRHSCDFLYSSTDENQVQEQILLGVGGYNLAKILGLSPRLYHCNEGRPAFLAWPLAIDLKRQITDPQIDVWTMVRSKIAYTNHTLLSSGNVTYADDLLAKYAEPFAQQLGQPVTNLLQLGQNPNRPLPGRFSITDFALNVSRKANGVSRPHTKLAMEQWPQHKWANITNGVHLPTWQKPEFQQPLPNATTLWQHHRKYKQQLAMVALQRTGYSFDTNRLIIGWGRRITGYKQLPALFVDIERLNKILRHTNAPAQLVIAGKAHPGDNAAKLMLQEVIHHFQNELSGTALFIPNYDLELAQAMVAGCDIWLNTPELGWEASGTSGMKACSNGVLQCTVADGWAAEVEWSGIGWTIDPGKISESVYERLEKDIQPLWLQRDDQGVPQEWVSRMRQSITLAEHYSAQRMLSEYRRKLY
jgi:glycogen phosphorylase